MAGCDIEIVSKAAIDCGFRVHDEMDQPLGLLMNFGAHMFRDGLKRIIDNRSDYVAPSGT